MVGIPTNCMGLSCGGFCDEAALKDAITVAINFEV
jgi:hypothetical protein